MKRVNEGASRVQIKLEIDNQRSEEQAPPKAKVEESSSSSSDCDFRNSNPLSNTNLASMGRT